jgi:hypothetical protein
LGLLGQFTKLRKATNNSFALTLAVGGWTWSKNFSLAVATDSSRHSLAQSIIDLFSQWSCFNGVSIDWEYLSNDGVNYGNEGNVANPADGENFAKFLEILRFQFNQKGWHKYHIAMCCTAAPEKIKFDVHRLIPLLDEWHLMTYEYPPSSSLPRPSPLTRPHPPSPRFPKVTLVSHLEHGPLPPPTNPTSTPQNTVRYPPPGPQKPTSPTVSPPTKSSSAPPFIPADSPTPAVSAHLAPATLPINPSRTGSSITRVFRFLVP